MDGARSRLGAALVTASMLVCAGWAPPVAQVPQPSPAPPDPSERPEAPDPFDEPPPRDPDDAPFMAPPNNQVRQWSAGRDRPITRGFDDDHRFQLSVVPTYAAFHAPFIGRGNGITRGGGAELDFDIRVFRWLFVRLGGSYTAHPVFAESEFDDGEDAVVPLAEGGIIHATNGNAGVVYSMDIGRFVPRIDAGAGLLFVRTPAGPLDGQWGGACRSGGVCDLGLSCSDDEICRPSPVFEAHAGIALDYLIRDHWAVGLGVRYYALISALADLPFYLTGSVRLSARF